MGRVNRLRVQRIQAGLESPRNCSEGGKTVPDNRGLGRALTCKLCGQLVLPENAREHIRKCWKVELRSDEPLPMLPTTEAVKRWISRRKNNGK